MASWISGPSLLKAEVVGICPFSVVLMEYSTSFGLPSTVS